MAEFEWLMPALLFIVVGLLVLAVLTEVWNWFPVPEPEVRSPLGLRLRTVSLLVAAVLFVLLQASFESTQRMLL